MNFWPQVTLIFTFMELVHLPEQKNSLHFWCQLKMTWNLVCAQRGSSNSRVLQLGKEMAHSM